MYYYGIWNNPWIELHRRHVRGKRSLKRVFKGYWPFGCSFWKMISKVFMVLKIMIQVGWICTYHLNTCQIQYYHDCKSMWLRKQAIIVVQKSLLSIRKLVLRSIAHFYTLRKCYITIPILFLLCPAQLLQQLLCALCVEVSGVWGGVCVCLAYFLFLNLLFFTIVFFFLSFFLCSIL